MEGNKLNIVANNKGLVAHHMQQNFVLSSVYYFGMEFSEGWRLGTLCSYSEIRVYLSLLCKSLHSLGMRAINRDHKDSENCIFLFLYYFRLWSCKHSCTLKIPTNLQYLKVQVSMPKCMLCFLPYFASAPKVSFTFQTLHFCTTLWKFLLSKPADYTGCAIYKFETHV